MWENVRMRAPRIGTFHQGSAAAFARWQVRTQQEWQFCAVPADWHDRCNAVGIAAEWFGGKHRKPSMTFNFVNVQQIAISAVAALFAASLFISAAVGPAGQLV
jgi:hypothetical protein